jgi:hypothetical protein
MKTTLKGLKVTCRLDRRRYLAALQVADEALIVNLLPDRFHGEWNHAI